MNMIKKEEQKEGRKKPRRIEKERKKEKSFIDPILFPFIPLPSCFDKHYSSSSSIFFSSSSAALVKKKGTCGIAAFQRSAAGLSETEVVDVSRDMSAAASPTTWRRAHLGSAFTWHPKKKIKRRKGRKKEKK